MLFRSRSDSPTTPDPAPPPATPALTFCTVDEPLPGPKWQHFWDSAKDAYTRWFLKEGDAARPSYAKARAALAAHMPELLPVYERLVDLAGGSDLAARLLSLWNPTPYLTACSQAVWPHGPVLVRNYDYSPALCDARFWRTQWLGSPVMAMSDCLWGVLDGINAHGLTVSLAFGGRPVVGEGFGIPIVLRYVLETCPSTRSAVKALTRIPVHMAYNVTLTDRTGDTRTAMLAPDRTPEVLRSPVATNHQNHADWPAFSNATSSAQRHALLQQRLQDPHESLQQFIDRFLQPPLYAASHARGWGTLYTAAYHPNDAAVDLLWPGTHLRLSLTNFYEACRTITYP